LVETKGGDGLIARLQKELGSLYRAGEKRLERKEAQAILRADQRWLNAIKLA